MLPPNAKLFGDKGYISDDDAKTIEEETKVRVIAARRKNMKQLDWIDQLELEQNRYARTNNGFEIKVHASILLYPLLTLTSNQGNDCISR